MNAYIKEIQWDPRRKDKSNYKKTCENTYHPLTNLGQKISILQIQSISLISGAQWIDTVFSHLSIDLSTVHVDTISLVKFIIAQTLLIGG